MSHKSLYKETSPKDIIEVYRTNISGFDQSKQLKDRITETYPEVEVSFDLEDCDKILRIRGDFDTDKIGEIAGVLNIYIQLLE